jgi:hypothetical protein
VAVSWTDGPDGLTLDLTVPDGVTAEVDLPDRPVQELTGGSHRLELATAG